MVSLYGGPSNVDKSFAALTGLSPTPEGNRDAPRIGGVAVAVGCLTLSDLTAAAVDVPPHFAKITGQAVPLMLGEEVFNRMVVDIDYAHHRLAFRDPADVSKPPRAVEVPVIELDGVRVVPLSINGAPPVQFELELGNVSGPLLVIPSYAQAHRLLEGHPTSQRLSGKFVEPVVTLDHLSFAGVEFSKVPIALVPDAALPPTSISGGVSEQPAFRGSQRWGSKAAVHQGSTRPGRGQGGRQAACDLRRAGQSGRNWGIQEGRDDSRAQRQAGCG